MSDCDKDKIVGYVAQTPEQIDTINLLKKMEIEIIDSLKIIFESCQPVDARWMSIAKTHMQEGFMAAVRAIARPNGD